MKCPHGGNEVRKENYNFKNFCFIVIMGIVESDYKFSRTSARLPRSLSVT